MPRKVVYKPLEKVKPIYAGGTITPPKFMPSYYEWLSTKGEQIVTDNWTTGTANVYVVPLNHTFFLTSIFVSGVNTHVAVTGYSIFYFDSSSYLRLVHMPVIKESEGKITNQFNPPLIAKGGQILRIASGTTTSLKTRASITGFLVKNNNIPSF